VRQILDARYVLFTCTEVYRKRFLGLEEFGRAGIKWEAKVIQNILYYEEINTGFIPVISMIRTAVLSPRSPVPRPPLRESQHL
jgi:hypothetical protein